MTPPLKKLARIAPVVFLADQAAKLLVILFIPQGEKVPILPGFFDLVHIRNPGAAFGFLTDLPDSWRLPFFYVTSAIALIILLAYLLRLPPQESSSAACLSLIFGGAMGNVLDRLVHGEVVDFLSFHWKEASSVFRLGSWHWAVKWEWPAFNLADAAITVGVAALVFFMLRSKKS